MSNVILIISEDKPGLGFRAFDKEHKVFVCNDCGDWLDQDHRAPYDTLCPCCRASLNIYLICQQLEQRL